VKVFDNHRRAALAPLSNLWFCGEDVKGGSGIGQKTLRQFCADEGINLAWAVSRSAAQGVTVRETRTMREIADSAGVHPRKRRRFLQAR
jgi:hypothetical protein